MEITQTFVFIDMHRQHKFQKTSLRGRDDTERGLSACRYLQVLCADSLSQSINVILIRLAFMRHELSGGKQKSKQKTPSPCIASYLEEEIENRTTYFM